MTPHNLIVSHSVSNCQALCRADCQDIGTRLALLHRDGGDGEDSDDGDDGVDGDEDDGYVLSGVSSVIFCGFSIFNCE